MFEDHRALFSPENGFWHTKEILKWAVKQLKPSGFVCLELDEEQIQNLESYIKNSKIWNLEKIIYDVFGKKRFVVVRLIGDLECFDGLN